MEYERDNMANEILSNAFLISEWEYIKGVRYD